MAQQEQIRERLRAHGFQFCDDHPGPPGSALTEAPGGIGPELRLTAVDSSSCDHESQTIHNTVEENEDRFWSSTGDERADVMEELLYALQDEAFCKFQAVGLYIYRATYQFGSPIYPPKMVAFEVGMHPTQLVAVPGVHVVSCSPDLQLFLLPEETPPARFVKVCLLGKQQRQLEDNKYYHAMKRVVVRGQPLSLKALITCSGPTFHPQRQAAALMLSSLDSSLDCPTAGMRGRPAGDSANPATYRAEISGLPPARQKAAVFHWHPGEEEEEED